jgi:hypothetical protein
MQISTARLNMFYDLAHEIYSGADQKVMTQLSRNCDDEKVLTVIANLYRSEPSETMIAKLL